MTTSRDGISILTDQLAERSAPLEIVLEEHGIIRAAEYDFPMTDFDCGIVFSHPEGPLVAGHNIPTNAEYYGLSSLDLSGTYEEISAYISERAKVYDPWWNGDPASESIEAIREWLDSETGTENLEHYKPEISEYLPGFEILGRLPAELREKLGMEQVELGGMASRVPAVAVSATAEELNGALESAGLPFRARDREGDE